MVWKRGRRSPRRREIPIGCRKEEDKQKQEKNPKRGNVSESVSTAFFVMKRYLPCIDYLFKFHLPDVFSCWLNDEISDFIFLKSEKMHQYFCRCLFEWITHNLNFFLHYQQQFLYLVLSHREDCNMGGEKMTSVLLEY